MTYNKNKRSKKIIFLLIYNSLLHLFTFLFGLKDDLDLYICLSAYDIDGFYWTPKKQTFPIKKHPQFMEVVLFTYLLHYYFYPTVNSNNMLCFMIYFVLMYYCTYLSAHAHHTSAHAIPHSIIYLDSSKNISTFHTIFNNCYFYVKNVSIIFIFMKNAKKNGHTIIILL